MKRAKDILKQNIHTMTPKEIFVAVVLSLWAQVGVAFTSAPAFLAFNARKCDDTMQLAASLTDEFSTRRGALSKVAKLLSVEAILCVGLPAYADISDGNALPEGAAQFGRVIRAKADIAVSKVVRPQILSCSLPFFSIFSSSIVLSITL